MTIIKQCMQELSTLTKCIFIWITRIITQHPSVDGIAKTLVHIHCNIIGNTYKEINKEALFPSIEKWISSASKKFDQKSFIKSYLAYLSEISSRPVIRVRAIPNFLNSGATVTAVTCPCHCSRSTLPSAFPITRTHTSREALLHW